MKKLIIAAFIFVSTFTTNVFAEIKMGIILGFTGPIESLTPAMAASAELAFKEASDSGSLLGGETISVVRETQLVLTQQQQQQQLKVLFHKVLQQSWELTVQV